MNEVFERLSMVLQGMRPAAVAVSGGVDSMTLSVVAGRVLGAEVQMMHAVSPAVPRDATQRVRRFAARLGWHLTELDSGEFGDADYLRNPVDRCFFCKTHLYRAIADKVDSIMLSGTNLDDLADYRPGLEAARRHRVRHPYVEAGMDKASVRRLAADLGLEELAELPAGPCLSSRIETGIAIDAAVLSAIHDCERLVARRLKPRIVRCRLRAGAIVVELDDAALNDLDAAAEAALVQGISSRFGQSGLSRPVQFQAYAMGSAFLRQSAHA